MAIDMQQILRRAPSGTTEENVLAIMKEFPSLDQDQLKNIFERDHLLTNDRTARDRARDYEAKNIKDIPPSKCCSCFGAIFGKDKKE